MEISTKQDHRVEEHTDKTGAVTNTETGKIAILKDCIHHITFQNDPLIVSPFLLESNIPFILLFDEYLTNPASKSELPL